MPQDYREIVQTELDRLDWTQLYLAELSGVPQSVINKWLSGRQQTITVANLEWICYALGLELRKGQ